MLIENRGFSGRSSTFGRLCLEVILSRPSRTLFLRLLSLCEARSLVGHEQGVEDVVQFCSEVRVLQEVTPFCGFEWHHSPFGHSSAFGRFRLEIILSRQLRTLFLRLHSLRGARSLVGLGRGIEIVLQYCSEDRVLQEVASFCGFEWHHSSFGLGSNPHPICFCVCVF